MRYKYVYFFNISKPNFDENKLWLINVFDCRLSGVLSIICFTGGIKYKIHLASRSLVNKSSEIKLCCHISGQYVQFIEIYMSRKIITNRLGMIELPYTTYVLHLIEGHCIKCSQRWGHFRWKRFFLFVFSAKHPCAVWLKIIFGKRFFLKFHLTIHCDD